LVSGQPAIGATVTQAPRVCALDPRPPQPRQGELDRGSVTVATRQLARSVRQCCLAHPVESFRGLVMPSGCPFVNGRHPVMIGLKPGHRRN
jgi:hypothetical protein